MTATRSVLAQIRHFLPASALLLAVAACDRLPFGTDTHRTRPPEETAALRIACRANVLNRTVSCDAPSEDGDARMAIVGGQNVMVRLTSSNVAVTHTANAAVADTFAFDVTVQNLLNEAMGTQDGRTPHVEGVRVFFGDGPTVTGGSGNISVANPDGVDVFTASNQPFFRYSGALLGDDAILDGRIGGGAGEVSFGKQWKLAFDDAVTSFTFVVFVDAQTQPLVAINEVMANPSVGQDSAAEYVEIINRGTLSVDLNGMIIQDQTGGGPNTPVLINQSVVIPGGRTALLGRSADPSQNGGIAPDFIYAVPGAGGVMQFSNSSADFVRIRRVVGSDTTTLDSAGYGLTAVSAKAGVARERISFAPGSASIDSAAYWHDGTVPYNGVDRGTPTPTSGETPGSHGSVILSANAPLFFPIGYDKPVFVTAVYDSTGTDVTATTQLTWTSSDSSVATVDSLGYVTGVGIGSVTIHAITPTGGDGSVSFSVVDSIAGNTANYRNHLEFGTPTDATPGDEILINRTQFVSSYNPNRRQPNWVSWDLNATHFEQGGTNNVPRCNCFTDEPRVAVSQRSYDYDYRNGGYDRGHMVQSESRTNTFQENATTFLLSNIVPQAAANNQGPWLALENHLDSLVQYFGKEVYIVAGGQYGATPPTLKNEGRVAIPEYTWKAALIVDAGEGLANVASSSDVDVIAVRMPNLTEANATAGDPRFAGTNSAPGNIKNTPWQNYVTTVDSIESTTGYDLFAALSNTIENEVEARQGTGTQLVPSVVALITQPSTSVTAGVVFPQQPVVEIHDQFGNPYPGAGRSVTVTINGGGTLNGTKTVTTASNGRATFTNLSIAEPGGYSLSFNSPGLPVGVTSDSIVVSAPTETAPSVSSTAPANGAGSVAANATIAITFSEPVNVTGPGAFSLDCSAFTVSGSGTSVVTLTPASALPASTLCSVQVNADSVTDVDAVDPPDAMASNYNFSFTTAAAGGGPAVLRLSEINPSVSSARDLVELVVVAGGSVNGMKLMQDSVTTLATLPNVTVATGDVIVVHFNPTVASGDATTPETLSKSENSAATNFSNAWDFQGIVGGIGASLRTIRILTSTGTMQDAVAAVTAATAPGSWPRSLQQIQEAGQWLPVDCGGAPCTTSSTPTASAVSASWAGAGTAQNGNSMRRVSASDTNMAADWAVGASSFGVANP